MKGMLDIFKRARFLILALGIVFLVLLLAYKISHAVELPGLTIENLEIGGKKTQGPEEMSDVFLILFGITTLTLAPYILMMTTSFIRITIVLSFLKQALGTQQAPPSQVLMALALFMTFYIMMPIGHKINDEALQPLMQNKIDKKEFFDRAQVPLKKFLLDQTRDKDLVTFAKLGKLRGLKSRNEVPIYVLLPAFIISEIQTAFEIGFILYLPFLVVDMVVATVLMAMGMFMLSPMSISLPFKLLLFVSIDGWNLLIENLVKSFRVQP